MSPRQILAEIIKDYHYNVAGGMPTEQSLEVLKAMVIDMIEYEREKAYRLGEKSGRFAERTETQFKIGSDHVSRHDTVSREQLDLIDRT